MGIKNISDKASSGILWTFSQRFAGVGVSFISGIILARLLSPEDYGIIGMLTIFITISSAFLDGGFGAALIQKKEPTQEDYSTIFFWNLAVSIVLYLTLFFSAPIIANFYRMPILSDVLRVQALVLIITAFSLVQSNQLQKQFKFKKIAIISFFSSIISLTVSIFMAFYGYGVWSLVTLNLLTSLIPTLVYWITNKWYPSLIFSSKSFKSLNSFGLYMFLTQLLNQLSNNIQGLLIGRYYNANIMGFYSKAKSTEKLASTSISQALNQVTLPLYSELQNDKPALGRLIGKLTSMVSFLTFPLMFLLILIAKPTFVLLYSDKWLESIPYFQVLCLSGISFCLQSVNTLAIAAIGKSKVMFKWTVIKRIISLIMMLVGLLIWGIYGLLFAMVLQSWLLYVINTYLVSEYIGYPISAQLKSLMPKLLLSLFSFCVAWIFGKFFNLEMYLMGLFQSFIFVSIYLGFSFIFNYNDVMYLKELFNKFKTKISI